MSADFETGSESHDDSLNCGSMVRVRTLLRNNK